MIGVVCVLLVCITILAILDIKEYLKNKKNSIIEENEKIEESTIDIKEDNQEKVEIFEIDEGQDNMETMEYDTFEELEPVKIEPKVEKQEEPLISEIEENSEVLSVQVNETKNINLEEELNKAVEPINSLEDTITNFEMEQEKNAIISIDELMKKSNELYDSNEIVQYDDGNEPISIDEVINRYNEEKEKVVPEVMECIEEKEEPRKLYSEKKTTPFISSVYGIENSNSLSFENTATYEKLDRSKNNEFMNKLREMSENK